MLGHVKGKSTYTISTIPYLLQKNFWIVVLTFLEGLIRLFPFFKDYFLRLESGASDPHLHPSCEHVATSSLIYLTMFLLLNIAFLWRVGDSFYLYHIYSS